MKTWLDKLCEPLEHPKYSQITGSLIKKDEEGNILGKCAEGEIACQNNIKYNINQSYLNNKQLEKLNIPYDFIHCRCLPEIYFVIGEVSENSLTDIGSYIYRMNDSNYTYSQIVEFLRVTFEDAV